MGAVHRKTYRASQGQESGYRESYRSKLGGAVHSESNMSKSGTGVSIGGSYQSKSGARRGCSLGFLKEQVEGREGVSMGVLQEQVEVGGLFIRGSTGAHQRW